MKLGWVACVLAVAHGVAAAQTCRASQLSATVDLLDADQIDGGLGHHALVIEILNRSFPICDLQGTPKIDFVYEDGRSAGVKTCSNCEDYLFARQPSTRIVLKPDQSAWVVLGYNINDGAGACVEPNPVSAPNFHASVTLLLRLRNGDAPLKVKINEWRSCGTINVTPFLAKPPAEGNLPGRS